MDGRISQDNLGEKYMLDEIGDEQRERDEIIGDQTYTIVTYRKRLDKDYYGYWIDGTQISGFGFRSWDDAYNAARVNLESQEKLKY